MTSAIDYWKTADSNYRLIPLLFIVINTGSPRKKLLEAETSREIKNQVELVILGHCKHHAKNGVVFKKVFLDDPLHEENYYKSI